MHICRNTDGSDLSDEAVTAVVLIGILHSTLGHQFNL